MIDSENLALSIDIGGTKIKFGFIDLTGKLIKDRILESKVLFNEGLQSFINSIEEFINDYKFRILGIGIGIPGIIDKDTKIIQSVPNLRTLEGVKLQDIIQDSVDVLTIVDNDVNLAALGEKWFGGAKEVKDFVFIAIGTGIGGGIIIDGKLYYGSGGAGEIGHIVVERNGPICSCGNRGCFEALASGRALERMYNELTNKFLTAREIFTLAKRGDSIASQLIDSFIEWLGIGIGSIINVLAPEAIIIGGGIGISQYDLIYPRILDELKKTVRSPLMEKLEVKKSVLGSDAGIFGGAAIIFAYANNKKDKI
jgi:glucokinase